MKRAGGALYKLLKLICFMKYWKFYRLLPQAVPEVLSQNIFVASLLI